MIFMAEDAMRTTWWRAPWPHRYCDIAAIGTNLPRLAAVYFRRSVTDLIRPTIGFNYGVLSNYAGDYDMRDVVYTGVNPCCPVRCILLYIPFTVHIGKSATCVL